MSQEYAIECTCSHRRERSQLAFARRAIEVLPEDEWAKFEPSQEGLKVLAETELALERPLARLRETYGEAVCIGPLKVRCTNGNPPEEPHMGLRLVCPPDCYDALLRDLQLRRALIVDAERGTQLAILRATAPLARLVGYPASVDELTGAQARLVMWLSHYAPVDEPLPNERRRSAVIDAASGSGYMAAAGPSDGRLRQNG